MKDKINFEENTQVEKQNIDNYFVSGLINCSIIIVFVVLLSIFVIQLKTNKTYTEYPCNINYTSFQLSDNQTQLINVYIYFGGINSEGNINCNNSLDYIISINENVSEYISRETENIQCIYSEEENDCLDPFDSDSYNEIKKSINLAINGIIMCSILTCMFSICFFLLMLSLYLNRNKF